MQNIFKSFKIQVLSGYKALELESPQFNEDTQISIFSQKKFSAFSIYKFITH